MSTPLHRQPVLWILIGLVVVLGGGWVALQMQTLQQQVADLDRQVSEARDRAEEAEERADLLSRRAEAAEDRARQARSRADAASALAETEASRRDVADAARRAAELDAVVAEEAAQKAEAEAVAALAEAARARAERDRELNRMTDALSEIVETQRTALGLVMNLGEEAINFDIDRAELKPEDRELLSRIVGVLLTSSDYRIQVFGHTDDTGTPQHNQRLSERRADAVADYLVEAGIDPEIITRRGFGMTRPLVEGTSDEARSHNRRVELGIIDSSVEYRGERTDERR